MTALDRGVLARIDRKLLAGLDQDETWRMVRIPVTAAKWSTWKRYCDSAGISMGRAIVTLIDRELISVFDDHTGSRPSVLAEQAEEELANRQTNAARRELRRWNEHLRSREDELEARELRIETRSKLSARPADPLVKVGRNDRCPCGQDSSTSNATACQVGSRPCCQMTTCSSAECRIRSEAGVYVSPVRMT